MPTVLTSTSLVVVMLEDRSPSYASVAVAPASVYEPPASTETGFKLIKAMVGGVESTTITVLTAVAWLPASLTV